MEKQDKTSKRKQNRISGNVTIVCLQKTSRKRSSQDHKSTVCFTDQHVFWSVCGDNVVWGCFNQHHQEYIGPGFWQKHQNIFVTFAASCQNDSHAINEEEETIRKNIKVKFIPGSGAGLVNKQVNWRQRSRREWHILSGKRSCKFVWILTKFHIWGRICREYSKQTTGYGRQENRPSFLGRILFSNTTDLWPRSPAQCCLVAQIYLRKKTPFFRMVHQNCPLDRTRLLVTVFRISTRISSFTHGMSM